MSSPETPQPESATCCRCHQPIVEGQRVEHGAAVYCLTCVGQALNVQAGASARKPHNPTVAILLSLVPGLGQMYNRQLVKGLVVMAACIFIPLLNIPLYFWNLFDAYWTARWIRETGQPTPPLFVPEWLNLTWPTVARPSQVPVSQPASPPAWTSPAPAYPPPAAWTSPVPVHPPAAAPEPSSSSPAAPAWGVLLIILGMLFLLYNFDATWLTWHRMWPAAMLALGLYLVASFALARRQARRLDEGAATEPTPTPTGAQEASHD